MKLLHTVKYIHAHTFSFYLYFLFSVTTFWKCWKTILSTCHFMYFHVCKLSYVVLCIHFFPVSSIIIYRTIMCSLHGSYAAGNVQKSVLHNKKMYKIIKNVR